MMNTKLVITLVITVLLLAMVFMLLPMSAHGQMPGFIITNADATTYVTITASSQLTNLIRLVPPRFVIQYANADRFYGFTYPAAMISDTIPPQITGTVACNIVSTDTVEISWMTNEYANGAVLYGTLSGVYTRTVSDLLYFKLHSFTLVGLMIGTPYHYEVRNVDRSGNIFLSSEYICTIPAPPTDLQVIKFDSPDPARMGGTLTYTLVVTNNGPAAATGVILTDTLPASVIFASASSTQGSCGGTNTITCSLGALNASTSATVTIVVTPTVGGSIINTASVSSDVSDPDIANNTDSESTTVLAANLSVTKTDAPDPAYLGQPLTYTIIATNNGPTSATGVMLTDTLPSSVSLVSFSPSQGVCNGGSVIACNLGALNNGGSATLQIVVTPLLTGMVTNTVTISGNEPDPSLANNVVTQTTTVLPAADLSVTASDFPDPLKIGGVLTYTLVVANTGPSPATDVTLTDTLPSTVIFGSTTSSQGTCTGTNTVACSLGTLTNGSSATVTIVVTPTKLGTIANLANVTANEPDLNMANNTDIETTSVRAYVYLPVILR